ncbi:MAG: hypothetical protein COX41_04445 [Candidatus Omnitrophica bacterium CG23_combo_of_CG06-09_8_20_14_all_41_10]|uniref:Uncharacterized protein n=1 Tax=Candidatus Sherwoodlollariibacterium unditelluris TaxID=1974757 RepID=A0A2G9YKT8_9BACT|nr:MAG: hypothetical protein COX41_04445 [Candidatus Omnitrophica bacterium CG23_combo_of_CG06-09_8_20_14_all_41_10]
MAQFKTKEEYEKWKAQKSKEAEEKRKQWVNTDSGLNLKAATPSKNERADGKKINSPSGNRKLVISLLCAGLLIGIGGTLFFMKISTSKENITQVSEDILKQRGQSVDGELKRHAIDTLKELDDLKYGFKVGLSYIAFSKQLFEVQKKIERIEDIFSNNTNLNASSLGVLSSVVSAKIYLDIIDCIWKDKIEKNTLTIVSVRNVYNPDPTTGLCIMNYTLDKKYLQEKAYYKKAFSALEHYYNETVKQRGGEGKKIIEDASNVRYSGWEAEQKRAKEIQDTIYSPYISDFMNMYTEEVNSIQTAVK